VLYSDIEAARERISTRLAALRATFFDTHMTFSTVVIDIHGGPKCLSDT
jgi:hypothetical protein